MGVSAGTLALISTGVGIVSAVGQAKEARKARKSTEQANRLQNKQARLKQRRDTRKAIAKARIQRAQTIAGGFSAGISGSSIVAGATGGIQSDLASNVGFSNVQGGLQESRIGALGAAASAQGQANIFGIGAGIADKAAEVFSSPQSVAALKDFTGIK